MPLGLIKVARTVIKKNNSNFLNLFLFFNRNSIKNILINKIPNVKPMCKFTQNTIKTGSHHNNFLCKCSSGWLEYWINSHKKIPLNKYVKISGRISVRSAISGIKTKDIIEITANFAFFLGN